MKQAILILAHKKFEHLESIVRSFDEDFEIYIHVDKKMKIPQVVYKQLISYPQVKLLIQRYKIYWGGLNIVKATLLLCKEALKSNEIGYMHVISGGDSVVKNIGYLKTFFEQNKHTEFLENFCLPTPRWEGGGLNRLEYYYFNNQFDVRTTKGSNLCNKLLKWQKKLHIKRKISFEGNIYGGSNWWSLSWECVQYVVNYTETKSELFKRLRFTLISDEIYFQTVIMNSRFAKDVVNDNLRYIVWQYRNGNRPANLDIQDLKPMLRSNKIFARKIEFPYAFELINKLQKVNSNYLQIEQKKKTLDKESLLQQIANYLYLNAAVCPFEGLYYGKAGIAVFLFHYARYVSDVKYSERGYELLVDLTEQLENIDTLDYSEGVFGIASALEYLHLNHFIEDDTNEILQDIDDKVLRLVKNAKADEINGIPNIYRLDKYLEFRVLNKQQTNILRGCLEQLQDLLQPSLSISTLEPIKTELTEYLKQISLARGMGIVDGYAGIGLNLLADISEDYSWRNLFQIVIIFIYHLSLRH